VGMPVPLTQGWVRLWGLFLDKRYLWTYQKSKN
jgi:hypothetical protein